MKALKDKIVSIGGKPFLKLSSASHSALAAAVLFGLAGGFLAGGKANAVRADDGARSEVAVVNATAAPRFSTGVDLDGDGQLDLARPVQHLVRDVDAYGSGVFGASRDRGRRVHMGADFVATAGEFVRAPISGVVTRIGVAYAGQDYLRYVEVYNPQTLYRAKLLYVAPTVTVGMPVSAGDIIGQAQSLANRYSGITNHVHVEITGKQGQALDPSIILPKADPSSAKGSA